MNRNVKRRALKRRRSELYRLLEGIPGRSFTARLERVARDLIQGIPPARIFVIPFLWNDNERGFAMGRPHPIELRRRVVDFVEEGHSHRSTAAHFRVSVRFVNDMVKLKRETGSLAPKRQGNPGRGKLADVQPWVRAYVLREKDPTLNELVVALREHHGIEVERSSVCRLLQRLGLTYKKRSPRG